MESLSIAEPTGALPLWGAEQIARLLGSRAFRFTSEVELQAGIASVFVAEGIEFAKEVVLSPRDRIDFLVGGIGIEVKVAGSITAIERQLLRYAESPRIENLVLVSTRASHQAVPVAFGGKPVCVVHLLASIF